MIVKFQHHLHDDKESWADHMQEALEEAGMSADEAEAVRQRSQMPFYEIVFDCELDTETGNVTYRESTT